MLVQKNSEMVGSDYGSDASSGRFQGSFLDLLLYNKHTNIYFLYLTLTSIVYFFLIIKEIHTICLKKLQTIKLYL